MGIGKAGVGTGASPLQSWPRILKHDVTPRTRPPKSLSRTSVSILDVQIDWTSLTNSTLSASWFKSQPRFSSYTASVPHLSNHFLNFVLVSGDAVRKRRFLRLAVAWFWHIFVHLDVAVWLKPR